MYEVFYHHDQLTKRINYHTVLVAINAQQLIGFLDGSNDQSEALLYALYLKPNAIGKGTGSMLFNEYIRRIHPMTVTVDVEIGNELAAGFYDKHGFSYDTAFVDEVFDYPLKTERYIWRA